MARGHRRAGEAPVAVVDGHLRGHVRGHPRHRQGDPCGQGALLRQHRRRGPRPPRRARHRVGRPGRSRRLRRPVRRLAGRGGGGLRDRPGVGARRVRAHPAPRGRLLGAGGTALGRRRVRPGGRARPVARRGIARRDRRADRPGGREPDRGHGRDRHHPGVCGDRRAQGQVRQCGHRRGLPVGGRRRRGPAGPTEVAVGHPPLRAWDRRSRCRRNGARSASIAAGGRRWCGCRTRWPVRASPGPERAVASSARVSHPLRRVGTWSSIRGCDVAGEDDRASGRGPEHGRARATVRRELFHGPGRRRRARRPTSPHSSRPDVGIQRRACARSWCSSLPRGVEPPDGHGPA